MEYPKRFEACPNCGSGVRIMELEVKEQQEKGAIPKDRFPAVEVTMVPVVDPVAGNYLQAPVIAFFWDICAGCGYKYPANITKQILPREQIEMLLGMRPPTAAMMRQKPR